ncbi:MAG: hypothetical protein UU49_C0002G0007 [Candidatus Magasanikbacteria bacterium GW2011_GWC2_41_17]|uniref:Uncharacterized protein n=1 Tax=Candidatus Magasanikbacteria bacterium GW2011_GWC2_41_17 TaxID=1619048 RepID=A0A0G0VGF6_9BACT|nr:MAG: hypothetical protein UU49_C0002G0007 [Candidatus Magasanikbacteria bacterium GW2011_GWC2_41_17]
MKRLFGFLIILSEERAEFQPEKGQVRKVVFLQAD